jgi:hypothetical protein
MKQRTAVFAVLTAALSLGGTMGMACGGRLAPAGSEATGGSGGSGATGGGAGNDGSGGTTSGTGGSGGTTSGTGGSGGTTGGTGGSGATTGGTGGSGATTGGIGGSGGSTGGSGGGAGRGGTGGAGGTDVPGTIRCGTSICAPLAGTPVGNLQPCCPMDTPNACGAVSPLGGCFTTTRGVPDPRCPMVVVMNSFPLSGCCRPNGLCGVDLQVINLGCNDPVLVGGMPASPCRANDGNASASMETSVAGSNSAPSSEAPAD